MTLRRLVFYEDVAKCTRDFLSLQEALNRNKNTQQEITVGELQLWRENDRSAKLNRQPEKM